MTYSFIFFDVAGTLLYKKDLFETIASCLNKEGFDVPLRTLRLHHALTTSVFPTPTKTTRDYLDMFHTRYLYSLGIVPKKSLLESIYTRCRQLEWEAFSDVDILGTLSMKKGIISNWDTTLETKLAKLIPFTFDAIYSSARMGIAKPHTEFYSKAFADSGVSLSNILYVGDSVELDMEPVCSFGVSTVLIDRENRYPWYSDRRISSLHDLKSIV